MLHCQGGAGGATMYLVEIRQLGARSRGPWSFKKKNTLKLSINASIGQEKNGVKIELTGQYVHSINRWKDADVELAAG
jgi:hypothetical protein